MILYNYTYQSLSFKHFNLQILFTFFNVPTGRQALRVHFIQEQSIEVRRGGLFCSRSRTEILPELRNLLPCPCLVVTQKYNFHNLIADTFSECWAKNWTEMWRTNSVAKGKKKGSKQRLTLTKIGHSEDPLHPFFGKFPYQGSTTLCHANLSGHVSSQHKVFSRGERY